MTRSVWLDEDNAPRPGLEGKRTADAVILGAGMTGIGLAHFLAERGVAALVVERDVVAGGATGRNLGLLVSGLGEHYACSIEFWGRQQAAAITRLNLQNHALVSELVDRFEIDCGYRRAGSLTAGIHAAEEEDLRRSCRLMQEDGFTCTFLEAEEMNRALGARGFLGGVYTPGDGVVNSVQLVRRLARVVENAGAGIVERTPVRRMARAGADWVVEAAGGSVTTPLLFLACNAWLPLLCGHLPLRPVRGQCCAFAAPESSLPEMACLSNYGAEYWRRAGGYCLFGGFRRFGGAGEESDSDRVTENVQSALVEFVHGYFPLLQAAPVTHRWSGIMAYTPDGLPLVGRVNGEKDLYAAAGYTGHGYGSAFLAARWLAELALEGKDEIPAICRIDRPMRPSPSLQES